MNKSVAGNQDHIEAEITVRPATEQDMDILINLYYEFHAFHVRYVPDRLRVLDEVDETYQAELRAALSALLKRDDVAIFVAQLGETMAGLAEVYLRQDDFNPLRFAYRYGYLQSLIVSESFRKHGVGKRLVETVHEWARERSASEVQLDTWEFAAGPLHFYEGLGYRTLRRHMVVSLKNP